MKPFKKSTLKQTIHDEKDPSLDFVDKIINGEPVALGEAPGDNVDLIFKEESEPGQEILIDATDLDSKTTEKTVNDRETGRETVSESTEKNEADALGQSDPVQDFVNRIIAEQTGTDEKVDPEFLNDFLAETREHIESIEMNVLDLETDPGNIEIVHSLFRSFHTVKGLAGFVNQNLVREIAHQTETRLDKCRKGEAKINKYFIDLVLASSDYLKKICDDFSLNIDPEFIEQVAAHLDALNYDSDLKGKIGEQNLEEPREDKEERTTKIGEILINQGLDPKTVEELLAKQDEYPGLKLGQIAVKEKKAQAHDIIQSLRIQEKASKTIAKDSGYNEYTRVPVMKIDNLVDLIGELVITQSQIEQESAKRFGTNDLFTNKFLRMQQISKNIQNISMSLRMVSFRSTFQKLNRIARDTISELGKNVCLEIYGEETEIDRGVAERMLDPLLHLVKNSISHGIEEESVRIMNGKPPQGRVKINACNKRGSVFIEVRDDGQGINVEKIHQKAIEKRLLDPAKAYSDEEIVNTIFLPGFSTAVNVSNVSGRGVGLDVVKTEIYRIGGKIEIDNHPGEGCGFALKIPINMAVINGTIIDILGNRFIIPTLYIKRIIRPEEKEWISVSGRKVMLRIKDEVIPVIPINKIFGVSESEVEEFLIIIIELEHKLKALPVRNIISRREIVVKSLGREFSHLDYVAGASILGDGRVSLILDIENLFKHGEAV